MNKDFEKRCHNRLTISRTTHDINICQCQKFYFLNMNEMKLKIKISLLPGFTIVPFNWLKLNLCNTFVNYITSSTGLVDY